MRPSLAVANGDLWLKHTLWQTRKFGDMEGEVFSRESIEAALQDFDALSL